MRSRDLVGQRVLFAEFARRPEQGVYLRIGNTSQYIYEAAQCEVPAGPFLESSAVDEAANFKTTLRRLKPREFELLFRHGFEVTDATLSSRQSNRFTHMAYENLGD